MAGTILTALGIAFLVCMLSACTISFQNIDTHGTATDLVDEDQTASPNLSASIPLKP